MQILYNFANVENKILVIIFIKNQHNGVYCENF